DKRRGQRGDGGLALQHAGEPGQRQAKDRQEQDPAAPGGIRRPPASRRPSLSGGQAQSGGADHRQRPVAPGEVDRGGIGGSPEPGVQAAPQLQPAAQRDRAVLEVAPASCDPQPAVRQPGGAEEVVAGEPLLLPDDAGPGPADGRQGVHPARRSDTINGFV
ncbi:MAG: hypothetical protein AVDCRST_MAG64-2849, partial [uncultured Phycisphaerae bacterium]